MNRDDARKNAEVMLAYANGADIEIKEKETGEIFDEEPEFNFGDFEYEVKKISTYIPYTFTDNLIGLSVMQKGMDHCKHIIIYQSPISIGIGGLNLLITYAQLLEDYLFTDGNPCGKLE